MKVWGNSYDNMEKTFKNVNDKINWHHTESNWHKTEPTLSEEKLTVDQVEGKELLNWTWLSIIENNWNLKIVWNLKDYKATFGWKEVNLSKVNISRDLNISKSNDGNLLITSEWDTLKLEKVKPERKTESSSKTNGLYKEKTSTDSHNKPNKSMEEINKMLDWFEQDNREKFWEKKVNIWWVN